MSPWIPLSAAAMNKTTGLWVITTQNVRSSRKVLAELGTGRLSDGDTLSIPYASSLASPACRFAHALGCSACSGHAALQCPPRYRRLPGGRRLQRRSAPVPATTRIGHLHTRPGREAFKYSGEGCRGTKLSRPVGGNRRQFSMDRPPVPMDVCPRSHRVPAICDRRPPHRALLFLLERGLGPLGERLEPRCLRQHHRLRGPVFLAQREPCGPVVFHDCHASDCRHRW